jgi:hypothetical protein
MGLATAETAKEKAAKRQLPTILCHVGGTHKTTTELNEVPKAKFRFWYFRAFEGAEELKETKVTQPAVFLHQ